MIVSTGEVNAITASSADISGEVIDIGEGVTQYGHCYGKSPNVDVSGTKTQLGVPPGNGGFTSELSGLESNTKYYAKAYLSNGSETVYGREISFTTLTPSGVVITTATITEIGENSAVSGGDISEDGGDDITSRGVCWSISPNPTVNNPKTIDGDGKGVFISSITELSASTTYYVRAYAINNSGPHYGNERSFMTSIVGAIKPSVTTTPPSGITSTSVISGGDVSSIGGVATPTARGVCYGTSANPDIAGPKTNEGPGFGNYVSNITGLNPSTTYYVRAYATNGAGTGYGNSLSFITSSITLVAPSGLSADSETSSQVFLSWTDNSDNEDGFIVERSLDPVSNWAEIYTSGANQNSFRDAGLAASTTYFYRVKAFSSAGSSDYSNTASATTPPEAKAILHIVNNSHYDIIDITLNDVQHVVVPGTGVLIRNSYDAEFTSPGPVTYTIGVGFWDGSTRNVWFFSFGEESLTLGNTTTLTINNPTIGEFLSNFSSRYWQGIYYDEFSNYHTAGYNFSSTGEWIFYDDGFQVATGSVISVSWPDYATTITFKTCGGCANILFNYPFGSFYYQNGPASWPTIEYVGQ